MLFSIERIVSETFTISAFDILAQIAILYLQRLLDKFNQNTNYNQHHYLHIKKHFMNALGSKECTPQPFLIFKFPQIGRAESKTLEN